MNFSTVVSYAVASFLAVNFEYVKYIADTTKISAVIDIIPILVILSLFLVSIFFSTTPSPCIKGYTGYVESSLFNLLLVRLGQNEHPKSLLVSMTFAHASDLTCNK